MHVHVFQCHFIFQASVEFFWLCKELAVYNVLGNNIGSNTFVSWDAGIEIEDNFPMN